ncbi:hypothetical protein [Bacillus sp. UNC438CL73TsuS30]|nr:hypothetical protein [Bacillus sp. UNC438CL73TsuS30]
MSHLSTNGACHRILCHRILGTWTINLLPFPISPETLNGDSIAE